MSNTTITLLNLPKYPLTETFGKYNKNFKDYDMTLLYNKSTSLVSVKKQVSPKILYDNKKYHFRSSHAKSQRDTIFFLNFVKKYLNRKKVALDIGGNDLFFANLVKNLLSSVTVVDPISKKTKKIRNNIFIESGYYEKIYFKKNFSFNLVICRHTMEHISNLDLFLKKLNKDTADDCLFLFEVPDFNQLVMNKRFDAIIHHHYHYFTPYSLEKLLKRFCFEIIDFKFNKNGSCGGSFLFVFKKNKFLTKKLKFSKNNSFNLKIFKKNLIFFKNNVSKINNIILNSKKIVYGYGAGLMLPTLEYYLRDSFKKIKILFDDDIQKHNTGYKNINVKVKNPNKTKIEENSLFLITSMENKLLIKKKFLKSKSLFLSESILTL